MDQEDKTKLAELITSGRKIEAIKLYREATGEGLKEAKEDVETLEREMREKYPEDFPEKKGGCAGMVLIGLIGLGGFSLFFV
jgi:ribosomal protein L7/L12